MIVASQSLFLSFLVGKQGKWQHLCRSVRIRWASVRWAALTLQCYLSVSHPCAKESNWRPPFTCAWPTVPHEYCVFHPLKAPPAPQQDRHDAPRDARFAAYGGLEQNGLSEVCPHSSSSTRAGERHRCPGNGEGWRPALWSRAGELLAGGNLS